jgi:hypothetical protein
MRSSVWNKTVLVAGSSAICAGTKDVTVRQFDEALLKDAIIVDAA